MIIALTFLGGFLLGGMIATAIAFYRFRRSYGYIEIHHDLEGLGKELILAKQDGHLSFLIDLVDVNCQVAIVDPRVNYLERMIK
jgi:hypothetical protein